MFSLRRTRHGIYLSTNIELGVDLFQYLCFVFLSSHTHYRLSAVKRWLFIWADYVLWLLFRCTKEKLKNKLKLLQDLTETIIRYRACSPTIASVSLLLVDGEFGSTEITSTLELPDTDLQSQTETHEKSVIRGTSELEIT